MSWNFLEMWCIVCLKGTLQMHMRCFKHNFIYHLERRAQPYTSKHNIKICSMVCYQAGKHISRKWHKAEHDSPYELNIFQHYLDSNTNCHDSYTVFGKSGMVDTYRNIKEDRTAASPLFAHMGRGYTFISSIYRMKNHGCRHL